MQFLSLLKYAPAVIGFLKQYGPLFLEVIAALRPVLQKMREDDVPHADKVLAAADHAQDIIVSVAQIEPPAARPEVAGA